MTETVFLNSLCTTLKKTINPQEHSEQELLHYSIPAFDEGFPTLEYGSEIQSNKIVIDRPCILFSRLNPRIRRVWDLSELNANRPLAIASTEFVPFVIVDSKHLHSRYLYWFFHTDRFLTFARAGVQAATKSRERVNKDHLFEVEIPLPPIEEQCRIAAILDRADAVRRKRQEAIRLTEELLRSLFLEMFGDPVTNPKGWKILNLGKLLAEPLQNGAYFPKDCYVENDSGIEMVHMSDAFYGIVNRGNLKRVRVTQADIEKYGLHSNDVLIARRSLNYEGSAKPCLIPVSQEPLIFESSLIRVRLNQEILDPIFFFSYMLQPRAREAYVFPHVTRSTISGINQAGLQRVQVLVPPIFIQQNYRRLYEKINLFGSSFKSNIGLSDNLFNSLLQRAFRGEL